MIRHKNYRKRSGDRWLRRTEEQRENELSFYCGHLVSELSTFYPDEYELLTRIAHGKLADVYEFTSDPSFTAHLKNYGLLRTNEMGRPVISIPVLERVVRLRHARKEGSATAFEVHPESERKAWIERRKQAINDNIEQLQREISKLGQPPLFGANSYPESHRFFGSKVVRDEQGFGAFINTCNRCFVEPIENYGKGRGHQKYFWRIVHDVYPMLGEAFAKNQGLSAQSSAHNAGGCCRGGTERVPQEGFEWSSAVDG